MAAPASSKPGMVHYFCAIFALTTVICGVAWYLSYSAYNEREGTWAADNKKASDDKTAMAKALTDVTTMKTALGLNFEQVGTAGDAANANTASAGIKAMTEQAGELAQPTLAATFNKVIEDLHSTKAKLAEADANVASRNNQINLLETEYNAKVKAAEDKTAQTETRLAALTTEAGEERAKKDKEIEEQRAALKTSQDEFAKIEDEFKKFTEKAEKREKSLMAAVQRLKDELYTLRNYGFEKSLGQIVSVDSTNNAVTINLGKIDRLQKRTTFSVYTKANSGVARGSEDIKGSLEVLDVIGPHLARCRITGETMPADPIAPGDPIYTPAWSPGRVEKFAFVGKFDFDGDGKDDRAQLYELVATNGAQIGAEVDMKGVRNSRKIDHDTKFLVVGEIPDPTEISDPEERRAVEEIKKHHEEMKKEADEQGVTVVRKNDFLSWMGYRPQEKLYKAGDPRPNNLPGSRTNGNRFTSGSRTGSENSYNKTFNNK